MSNVFVLTCEHASKKLPKDLQRAFNGTDAHQWYDVGAREYADYLSKKLSCPLFLGEWSRLLVDLNRSPGHPKLFFGGECLWGDRDREELLQKWYWPFRQRVYGCIQQNVLFGRSVIHMACHSFVPRLGGVERTMDLGLLYDPSRSTERQFAHGVVGRLREETSMRVRLNAPYRGISDGHVSFLRKHFSPEQYIGIEVEVNQSICASGAGESALLWRTVWLPRLAEVLREAIP